MRDGLLLGGFLVGVLMSSVFVTEPIFSPGECNEIIESVNKKKTLSFKIVVLLVFAVTQKQRG